MLSGFLQHRDHPGRLDHRHGPHRLDDRVRHRPVRVPVQEGRRRRCSCWPRWCPASPPRSRRSRSSTARPVRHPVGGDRAVHGHRHRLHLHLHPVHPQHPGVPGRGGPASTARTAFTIYWRIILPTAQAGHRHRGDHQGHHHLQRLLHPVPLHARRTTSAPSPRRCSGSRARSARTGRTSPPARSWSSMPTLVIFLLLQRFIYNGFTSGATK